MSRKWEVPLYCVNVIDILATIDRPEISKLILIDACRNNPFERSWEVTERSILERGMTSVPTLSNSMIILSTAENTTVSDDNQFAEILSRKIRQGGCLQGNIIYQFSREVRKDNPQQLIRLVGWLVDDICFEKDDSAVTVNTKPVSQEVQDAVIRKYVDIVSKEDISFEEKEKNIQYILSNADEDAIVKIYGANETLLEMVEIETFLKRLKFGEYGNASNFAFFRTSNKIFKFKKKLPDKNNEITKEIEPKSNLNYSQKKSHKITASGPLGSALTRAFNGEHAKFVKVHGKHEFHIAPINVVKGRGASGKISHHLSYRRDDQIYYTITLKNDGTCDIQYNVKRGGFGRVYNSSKVDDRAGKLIDGSWESSLETILNIIALYVE